MRKINFYAQNMYFCTLCVSSAVSCYTIGVSLLRPNNWTRCYATALLVYFLLVYIIGCDAWSLHCGCCSILDSTICNTYWTVSPFAVALLGLTTDLNPLSGRPIPPPDRQPARSSWLFPLSLRRILWVLSFSQLSSSKCQDKAKKDSSSCFATVLSTDQTAL